MPKKPQKTKRAKAVASKSGGKRAVSLWQTLGNMCGSTYQKTINQIDNSCCAIKERVQDHPALCAAVIATGCLSYCSMKFPYFWYNLYPPRVQNANAPCPVSWSSPGSTLDCESVNVIIINGNNSPNAQPKPTTQEKQKYKASQNNGNGHNNNNNNNNVQVFSGSSNDMNSVLQTLPNHIQQQVRQHL